MEQPFKSVGIIGKFAETSVGEHLHALRSYLQQRDLTVLLDQATAEVWPEHGLETASRTEIGQRCDLAVVLGGDGTLLNVARSLADHDIAIVGINMGRLGFLTDISPSEMEQRLDEILSGQFNEDERFLLHSKVIRDGEVIGESDAFNDVVVHKSDVARMIEVQTHVNGTFVNNLRADGLIVSTPTGSTAYALSGGGPLLQPCLNAVVLVPICPHTMSNRPIVVDGDTLIEIEVCGHADAGAQVTFDGQITQALMHGDSIRIRKKPHSVRLLHPVDHDHFHILRAKLNWG